MSFLALRNTLTWRRLTLLSGLLLTLGLAAFFTIGAALAIPQTRVESVSGNSVSGTGWDFPAGATFDVRLGPMSSRGIAGEIAGTATADADGKLAYTVEVPAALSGHSQIAIRLDGFQSYYSFAWFNNAVSGAETGSNQQQQGTPEAAPVLSTYTGYPTFKITGVDAVAKTVTIDGANFPPNQIFTFRINAMFTRGVNGTVVGTWESDAGGAVTAIFAIPEAFLGHSQVAIRADSPAGYFAYNWFYLGAAQTAAAPTTTTTTTSEGTGDGATGTGGSEPATTGPTMAAPATTNYVAAYPTFYVSSAVRGTSATIVTSNLPANSEFTVIMGEFGSLGLSGYQSATFNSGEGGTQTLTFLIPAQMVGTGKIAIRLQGRDNPYYAYAWFWN